MKRKFSKILGVGLTLGLLASMLLAAVPVSALGTPTVSFPASTDDDISTANADYDITFILGKELAGTGVVLVPTVRTANDTFTITFPSGYTIAATASITAALSASPGWLGTAAPAIWGGPTNANSGAFTSDATARTITYTVGVNEDLGQGATILVHITNGITNPSTVGSYTFTVATSQETTAVASAAYAISAPTISALPGVASVYNDVGILMNQKTGATAIADAITAAAGITKPVIKLSPGTYTENPDTATASTTFIATGTAAETIIKGNWTIDVASVTLQNLTLTGTVTIAITGDKATITNCVLNKKLATTETLVTYNNIATIVTDGIGTISGCTFDTTKETITDTAILINQLGLTVSGCSFTLDSGDVAINIGANATVKDCPSVTGTGGIGVTATAGTATVSGSTFDGLQNAFDIDGGTLTITGNVIKNCTGSATTGQEGAITIDGATTVVKITGNDINTTTTTKYAIYIDTLAVPATKVFVLFNNINNTLNIKNEDTTGDKLNATHNYWGAATGAASTSISGDVNTLNYLTGATTAKAASIATGTPSSLTAKTTAGVDVSSIVDTAGAASVTVSVIGAANYAANPGAATPYTALAGGFYDVYVVDTVNTDIATILFYNAKVASTTVVYVLSPLSGTWAKCAPVVATDPAIQGVNTVSGYAYVTVKGLTTIPALADLTGTVFALVTVPAAAPTLAAPTISAPTAGEKDVSIRPTFAWTPVTGAVAYYFELTDNPNFVDPLMKMGDDVVRLIVPFYHHMPKLDYSTSYYWRVQAVKGTIAGKDLLVSTWVSSLFITEAEPVVEVPPAAVWTCPQDGLTFGTREALEAHVATAHPPVAPIVIPAEELITPAWIYAVIGVGALLVIAVIVLIVRTRRVA